jgi:hypothetical protein
MLANIAYPAIELKDNYRQLYTSICNIVMNL